MATIEKRVTGDGTTHRVKVRLKGFSPESATFERMTGARQWATQIRQQRRQVNRLKNHHCEALQSTRSAIISHDLKAEPRASTESFATVDVLIENLRGK